MKIIVLTFIITVLAFISYDLRPTHSASQKIFNPPPKQIEQYSFGYKDLISSLFWVRVLQDIEICDQKLSDEKPKPFDPEKNRLEQILNRDVHKANCNSGWVYQMIDVITGLTPDFYLAYAAGGTFLSVLVDDREGAHKIYEKGISYYPEDWRLLYQAAYHELFEMQDPDRSAELLKRAGERGAPAWVFSLSAKLYSNLGRAQFAKSILESVLERKPEAEGIERVKIRLQEINEIIEKNAQ